MISFLERYLPAPVVILLLLALGVLLLPVFIPAIYVWAARYELHLRSLVKRSPCRQCGFILGMDSLRIGREQVRLEEKKFRSLSTWGYRVCKTAHGVAPRVVCVSCGARLVYREEHGFVDEAASERIG